MKPKALNIPVGVIPYVFKNKLLKSFRLYMYLKYISSGKIHKDSPEFKAAIDVLGIKDQRTFDRYIEDLLGQNWLGYYPLSGVYLVRSFKFINKQLGNTNRRSVLWYPEADLANFDAFLFAAVVGNMIIQRRDYLIYKRRMEDKAATDNRGVAKPTISSTFSDDYLGISVKRMGDLVGLSQSRAHELKARAEETGYLKCNNKFKEIVTQENPDYLIKKFISRGDPEVGKRVRFLKRKRDSGNSYLVTEQLFDEVIPLQEFKRVRKIKKTLSYLNGKTDQTDHPLPVKIDHP